MEVLIKMINIIAWIVVIACPLIVINSAIAQLKYEGSTENLMDIMKGYEKNYLGNTMKFVIIFIIALVYLIVKN